MTTHSHPSILVVEDDPSIASLIADALDDEIGAATVTFHTGTDAIAYFARHPVQLAIFDVQLPDTNGIAVYDAMRTYDHVSDTPVLFISANGERAAFQRRGLRFLRKPFDLGDLFHEVQDCLAR